ncbi:type ISP restriction/modification enzyme [Deinococcus murrayi]|uniref:type ISP restriction/modification enzyme n=1 Tax=Deinococcus murrayi TaxID=68910 RepID=UPI00048601C1|nr:type ISP restriction/modification enzyme [Deinococcus murrayi]
MAPITPRAALAEYIKAIRKAHGKGTPENTYLPLLKALLDGLLPEYEVITHPRKDEGGLPDFALRVRDGAENVALGEAEALDVPLSNNAHGLEQARRYARQAPTLLTNFHEFVVLDGERELERYTIPHGELLGDAKPAAVAEAHLDALSGLLNVWASARGSLSSPRKVAALLAHHARQALRRLEAQDAETLAPLRKAMEDALGVSFTLPEPEAREAGRKSSGAKYERDRAKWLEKQAELDHFFRSSLVQALFYGLFAGWVMAAQKGRGHDIDRETVADDLNIPVISLLLDEVNTRRKLLRLDLTGPVEGALDVLRRVEAEPFLRSFREGSAVTYFYEPFLEAFDPQLRKDLGIWYTPQAIIRFQIEQVHELLKTHLDRPLGLLDPDVTVLDPATGTGGYLLELARFLEEELRKEGRGRVGARLKQAFRERIFGFELLPAPFAIAHLQLALRLGELGAPLAGGERLGIYLTNSLNGWEPRLDKPAPLYAELAQEQALSEGVKQRQRLMVMLGNPPYDRFADMPDHPEELALVAPYKACLRESWGVKKQLLDDLYIRFIRLAEWRVAEHTGAGIVSFITNRSYLTGISHPVMRQHLLTRFDHLYIDDLHGNQRAHRPGDGSVFTTDTSGGIRVGVAVGTFVKLPQSGGDTLGQVHYRDYEGSGAAKRQMLLERARPYAPAFTPTRQHRYVLRPLSGEDQYWEWPSLEEVFPVRFSGLQASRDEGPMSFTKQELTDKMTDYFNPSVDNEVISIKYEALMKDGSGFNAVTGRREAIAKGKFDLHAIFTYHYRPFDHRFLYWLNTNNLLVRRRDEFVDNHTPESMYLIAAQTMRRGFDGINFSRTLIEFHVADPDARAFPLRLRFKHFAADTEYEYLPNVADFYDDLARAGVLKVAVSKAGSPCTPLPRPGPVLARYGAVRGPDGKPNALAWELAEEVFHHTLAMLSAPAYRTEHADYLAEDWPRVPLPESREVLQAGAALGRRVAALLDPAARPDLPTSLGRLVTPGTDQEAPAAALRIGPKPRYDEAREVYVLSEELELAGVPGAVWAYTLGGYPVLKNWVEYRRGRMLTLDDAEWLEGIVRRVAALLALGPELDAGYAAAKA